MWEVEMVKQVMVSSFLTDTLCLYSSLFGRAFPWHVSEHTFEDEMLLSVLGAFSGRQLGWGDQGKRERKSCAEFNLSSVSITQNDTNQPLLVHAEASLLPVIPSLLSKPLFSSA